MMKTDDFDYFLPKSLIARYPIEKRSDSRLLSLNKATNQIQHASFKSIIDFLNPGDCLVLNNTRVMKARLFGAKPTGGSVELLIERICGSKQCLAHVRASKAPKIGGHLTVSSNAFFEVTDRQDNLYALTLNAPCSILELMEKIGEIPLPPYLERAPTLMDQMRYQTVYNASLGAVAAPTAGLHFDETLLQKCEAKGVELAFLTLHVGAGTFQPVRVDDIRQHRMHKEYIDVPEHICQQIRETKARGNRVIAVGTTTVRALETATQTGEIHPYQGDTDIFIYPGFRFQLIDALITNFHLPRSTLLMLVSAFASWQGIQRAYQTAIDHSYRFFSYGDAMLIHDAL